MICVHKRILEMSRSGLECAVLSYIRLVPFLFNNQLKGLILLHERFPHWPQFLQHNRGKFPYLIIIPLCLWYTVYF